MKAGKKNLKKNGNKRIKKVSKTAILAFVPVLHKGYVDLFKNQEGDIWIFSDEVISQYIHLTRDLRTIDPAMASKSLSSIFPKRKINLVYLKDLKNWLYEKTIMPDDEVCRDLAEKYFTEKKVDYVSVFLRWNKVITFKELEISPDRRITKDEFHRNVIGLAFEEARKSSDWWRQIAAVAMKGGKIMFKAHNHHLPTDFHLSVNGDPRSNFDAGQHPEAYTSIHAEAEIIAKAAGKGKSLKGASLYTTTFPCPNCARLIGMAGIKKVYYSKGYSVLDAEKILNHFGVEVVLVQS